MLADARAPTLSAYALFAIVGALLADPRHLLSVLCFLLLLADEPVSARSSKKIKALARSSKKRKARSSANEHKALVKCAGLCFVG